MAEGITAVRRIQRFQNGGGVDLGRSSRDDIPLSPPDRRAWQLAREQEIRDREAASILPGWRDRVGDAWGGVQDLWRAGMEIPLGPGSSRALGDVLPGALQAARYVPTGVGDVAEATNFAINLRDPEYRRSLWKAPTVTDTGPLDVDITGDITGGREFALNYPQVEGIGALLPFVGFPGITAWHSSPRRFERFRASEIGTGHGAQQGHGLYFSEQPDVEGFYSGRFFDETAPGYIYKVDIPDEAIPKMLDWDAPFSEQPENVQKFFSDAGLYDLEGQIKLTRVNDELADIEATRATASLIDNFFTLERRANQLAVERRNLMANLEQDGAVLYRRFVATQDVGRGRHFLDAARRSASEALDEAGIPGIRFLDSPHRFTPSRGESARNFVVFDEDLPKILERTSDISQEALEKDLSQVQARIYRIENLYFNTKDNYENLRTPPHIKKRDLSELADLKRREAGLLERRLRTPGPDPVQKRDGGPIMSPMTRGITGLSRPAGRGPLDVPRGTLQMQGGGAVDQPPGMGMGPQQGGGMFLQPGGGGGIPAFNASDYFMPAGPAPAPVAPPPSNFSPFGSVYTPQATAATSPLSFVPATPVPTASTGATAPTVGEPTVRTDTPGVIKVTPNPTNNYGDYTYDSPQPKLEDFIGVGVDPEVGEAAYDQAYGDWLSATTYGGPTAPDQENEPSPSRSDRMEERTEREMRERLYDPASVLTPDELRLKESGEFLPGYTGFGPDGFGTSYVAPPTSTVAPPTSTVAPPTSTVAQTYPQPRRGDYDSGTEYNADLKDWKASQAAAPQVAPPPTLSEIIQPTVAPPPPYVPPPSTVAPQMQPPMPPYVPPPQMPPYVPPPQMPPYVPPPQMQPPPQAVAPPAARVGPKPRRGDYDSGREYRMDLEDWKASGGGYAQGGGVQHFQEGQEVQSTPSTGRSLTEEEWANARKFIGASPSSVEEPGFMAKEGFWNLHNRPGFDMRDLTDAVFNPSSKLDRALLPLMFFPPAAAGAKLAQWGYKGYKATRALIRLGELQRKIPGAALGNPRNTRGFTTPLGDVNSGRRTYMQGNVYSEPAEMVHGRYLLDRNQDPKEVEDFFTQPSGGR